MIEVLFNRASEAGDALQNLLSAEEVKKHVVVNWTGSPLSQLDHFADVPLNFEARSDKLSQALRLGIAGVPTVTVSLRQEGADWLPRRKSHQQGFDFTNKALKKGRLEADYFVRKENIVDEYRVHVFRTCKGNMRVLRVAKKVPSRDDHHPWVRAHRLGWKLSYVGGCGDPAKQAARDAVRSLLLDFGAVDVGILASGTPIVLEVNTCPGLEGGTLEMYATSILERAK